MQSRFLVDIDIFFRVVESKPDGDFLAERDRFTSRFILVDGKVVELAG